MATFKYKIIVLPDFFLQIVINLFNFANDKILIKDSLPT